MIAQDWPGPQCIMGNSESIYYSVSYSLAKLSKICETLISCDKERLELSLLHKNVNTSSHRKGDLMALTTVYQYELWLKVWYIPSQLSLPRQGPTWSESTEFSSYLRSSYPSYDMVDCRRTFGVVFPILKGSQLHIHHSESKWSFSTNRISVTQITTAQMAQIEIKSDLITKT